jgi:hypothetical protein
MPSDLIPRVGSGLLEENALKQKIRASVLTRSEPKRRRRPHYRCDPWMGQHEAAEDCSSAPTEPSHLANAFGQHN